MRSIPLSKQCKQSKNLTLVKTLATSTNILKKRMQNNDISEIINMERQDISPAVYHMLQNSQPTSASVERSFSMLKKQFAKNRNFEVENVRHYMILHFNAGLTSQSETNSHISYCVTAKSHIIHIGIRGHRHISSSLTHIRLPC